MNAQRRRAFVVALPVAALTLGLAASAYARTGDGPITIQNENVEFSGAIDWYPNSRTVNYGHGGMEVTGRLYDTKSNGHWVYVSALVEGYSYTRLKENHNGAAGASVYVSREVYDPAATYVTTGRVKACQDDNFADTCTEEYMRRNSSS